MEEKFFEFIKNNGEYKACWGFMLQQQDWDGLVNYYTYIAPDNAATGKPYYTLKYYYNSTGHGSLFEMSYDDETNRKVGEVCPHP